MQRIKGIVMGCTGSVSSPTRSRWVRALVLLVVVSMRLVGAESTSIVDKVCSTARIEPCAG